MLSSSSDKNTWRLCTPQRFSRDRAFFTSPFISPPNSSVAESQKKSIHNNDIYNFLICVKLILTVHRHSLDLLEYIVPVHVVGNVGNEVLDFLRKIHDLIPFTGCTGRLELLGNFIDYLKTVVVDETLCLETITYTACV